MARAQATREGRKPLARRGWQQGIEGLDAQERRVQAAQCSAAYSLESRPTAHTSHPTPHTLQCAFMSTRECMQARARLCQSAPLLSPSLFPTPVISTASLVSRVPLNDAKKWIPAT
eukprot:364541-Chlamydomonas_euryale.AAC.11